MSPLGNALRTSQVQIHCFDLIFDHLGGLNDDVRIIATKLSNQGFIFRCLPEVEVLVAFLLDHHSGVQHGGVAELRAIFSVQHTEGTFGLVYHGRSNKFRRAQGAVEVPSVLDMSLKIHRFHDLWVYKIHQNNKRIILRSIIIIK